MASDSGSHMVGRSCLAPAIAEFTGTAGEACTHIRIAEREDRTVLVYTLGDNKLEVTVLILRDCEIGDVSHGRIELRQVSAARLAVEHGNDLHSGFLVNGNIGVTGTGVTSLKSMEYISES